MSIDVSQSVTIGRPAAELYERWRDLPRLPELMQHLESVTVLDERRSHWVAKGPADTKVEWEATIVEDVPGEVISWRSVEGSEIPNEGRVEFNRAPADQGTELRVHLKYDPPAGVLGKTVARLFGEEPSQQIRQDLKRFKQLVEAGEIATIEGQPSGPERYTREAS